MWVRTFFLVLVFASRLVARPPLELSEPEKNFEALWQTFDRNYGIFTAKKVDWNALYEIYRPQVTAGTTDEELFDIFSRLLGHLNDNHVRLRAGERFFRSGILGEMEMEDFSLDLIKEKYLKGTFENRVEDVFTFGWVDGDIGYFHFRGFGKYDQSRDAIDTIIAEFENAKGIIVDVRQNGGGDDRVGKLIADRFADRKRHYMTTYTRNGPDHDDFGPPKYWYVEPDGPRQFTKTVVVLTHRFSISAAENFALAMRVIPHVTMVGDTTSGVFADVYGEELPNGWQFSVSYKLFVDHTGFCWEGVGVPADIRQINTNEDIEQGRDEVLDLAVALIRVDALRLQEESASTANLKESLVEQLARDIEAKGVDTAMEAFRKTQSEEPESHFVDEDELRGLGADLMHDGRSNEAVAVLELMVREFPSSVRAHQFLAEIYFDLGDTEKAREQYRQSLVVNRTSYPWEREAQEMAQEVDAGKRILTRFLESSLRRDGVMHAIEDYRNRPNAYFVPEGEMNSLGYEFLAENQVEEAIEILRINTEVFPNSWNAWDSLGEAYAAFGDEQLAIESYEKSLALNPDNDNAHQMLSKLKGD